MRVSIALTCWVLFHSTAVPQEAAQTAVAWTRAQMESDLRQLAKVVAREWAYADDRAQNAGVDLTVLADRMIGRLDDVAHDREFVGLVREFVAAMRDGHAFVAWDGKEHPRFRRWPFTVVDTADGLVVDEIRATWNATPVELVRGDVVLEVDDVPVADRFAEVARRTNASTELSRRQRSLARVVYNDTDPSRYRVRREDGSELVVTAYAAQPFFDSDARPPVASRRLAEGVHYVAVSTLAHHDANAWRDARPAERDALLAAEIAAIHGAFRDAENARALVLDLRGNGGGTDLLGMDIAACLLPDESVYYSLQSRGMLFGWSSSKPVRIRARDGAPHFTGQLVVLIDEGTFSAADNLCRCLDDLHEDVTFVGRQTGAGTGAPRQRVKLRHSGIEVTFCTMRVFGPGGELIEGRGTSPDVAVVATRDGVLERRDEILEAALRAVR